MMRESYGLGVAITLLLCVGMVVADDVADPVPPRSASGQTLEVPDEQLEQGDIFHVVPGVSTHVTWQHDATLVNPLATCSRAVGYFVIPFDLAEGDDPIAAGAVRIPVASLRSGYSQFDASLHSARYLNAAQYPEIKLLVKGVRDAKLTSTEHDRKIYELTLLADLFVRDQKIEVECPTTVARVPLTWDIIQLTHEDVVTVRTRFELTREQLGFAPTRPSAAAFTGEKVAIELALFCSMMPPDLYLDPRIEREHFTKQMQFLTLARDFRDAQKAYAFAREFAKEAWDAPAALLDLATAIVQEDDLVWHDWVLALKVAQRANELTESKDPQALHIMARVYYERGELEEALKWARKASEQIDQANMYTRPAIEASLPEIEAAVQREKAE